jgi:UDP-N-acetylmuramoylalanine--D-glutamate ligase
MTIQKLQTYKKILLVGYGKEGHAVEKFLQKFHPQASITRTDQKDGPDYLLKQRDFDLAVKSPGVPGRLLSIPYTTGTNLFFGNTKATVVGVTGSKGKSTTASLIAHMLKHEKDDVILAGNIGVPLVSLLLNENICESTIVVAELSSYQLEDIMYSPHVSVFTTIFPEHIPYHETVEQYYEAKHNLIAHTKTNDVVVYNPVDPIQQKWIENIDCKVIPYTQMITEDIAVIPLLGKHNRDNISAACTACYALGIPYSRSIPEYFADFAPLPHRLQIIKTVHDITYVDDAISTAPESTIAGLKALESIAPIGSLMLGGQDRHLTYEKLAHEIVSRKIPVLVFFPETGVLIEKAIQEISPPAYKPLVLHTSSMKDAVAFCARQTPKKHICLLSTASPSYTVWKNFEEKGDFFQKYVAML